jgi:hypothetical protein
LFTDVVLRVNTTQRRRGHLRLQGDINSVPEVGLRLKVEK